MLYRKKGLPEVNEIVLCQVTKLFPNSVFVDLLEYNDSGMVHISEVSPGRIRNLRDYVSVGRQIVCIVLRIDHEKNHIDLSLRRVNSTQRREKLDEIKQELKAESLISNLSKKVNIPANELYRKIVDKVFDHYLYLHLCFKDVVAGKVNLEKLGIEKKVAEELTQAVLDKFKPPKIVLTGEIQLETYSPTGLNKIKTILAEIQKVSSEISLIYLGAGRYQIKLEDYEYKPAEKKFKEVQSILEKFDDKTSKSNFIRL